MKNKELQEHLNLILFTDEVTMETDNAHIKICEAFNEMEEEIELLKSRSCTDCKWCKLGGEDENDECHNTSLSAHLPEGTMVSQDFSCNRWEER